jgi:Asp/Glu/hydantoin racemase
MSTTVCFFHTGASLSGRFDDLAAEYIPETDYYHAVDESVIDELLSVGELTPAIRNRICGQLSLAERAGADLILDTCSSTSPAVDVARQVVGVPIVKIDDPMAERAAELGEEVGLLATAGSTVGPSSELIERKAAQAGTEVDVTTALVDEAFEARTDGDLERHDRLVTERATDLAADSDVLVLAQASMAHLEPRLESDLGLPVLSSPELAMEHLATRVASIG